MSRVFQLSGLLAIGASCLLALETASAQQAGCTKGSSTASSTTNTGSSTTSTNSGSSFTSASSQVSQNLIRTELARLQTLLNQLVSGQVTAPAGSGLTTAQAIQVVQNRINILQRLAMTTASGSAGSTTAAQRSANSAALTRSGGGRR